VGILALAVIAGFFALKHRRALPDNAAPVDVNDTSILYDNVRHSFTGAGRG
jgi:hypothetical protein